MIRTFHRFSIAALALTLLAVTPLSAVAQAPAATKACPTAKVHSLPKSSGSTPARVFTIGVEGGSMRPWSVQLALDGTVSATGISPSRQQLTDAANTLKALLTLADTEGYFSMKKAVGCLGTGINPDVSSRYISIHTSTQTKRVRSFGSCAATTKYDQLYAVLEQVAGIGG
jgi:hypothetical protein